MHSSVFNWSSLKVEPTKMGERRGVFDAPTPALEELEMHITTLNPGESPHPPHRHAAEELMIIKEGTLEALQGGQTNIVEAGGIISRRRTSCTACATSARTARPTMC